MDVLKRYRSGYRLLGRCEIPALSSDSVEVMGVSTRKRWTPAAGHDIPAGHRFRVLRVPNGGRMALIPLENAKPEVLPGWIPAKGQRAR